MKILNKIYKNKKTGWALIIFTFTCLLACAQPATRQNKIETGNDKCLSPYFVVLYDDSETEQLPLKSTSVKANIAGVIADVEVKQTYTNTGKNPIEAIYVFPASTRAAVYQMVMKINDREIIALVEEKQTARNMYETAKQEGKTASLLEEQRPNVFQMNVANIVPGATVEVTLSYTELLVPTDGIYEFVYPTVVGPRYVSKAENEDNTAENWTSNPYLEEGVKPTSTLDIDVNINAGMPIKEIKCETHKNHIKYNDKSSASIILDEKDGGDKDFILDYRLAGSTIESGILTYHDPKGENYFIAMVQPPKRVEPEMVSPREYVFIVDVSGSMSGFPLDISKEVMKKLLSSLKPTDKFNIVLFAGGSNVYAEKSLPATANNISNALKYMGTLSGGGGTELLNALKTAMQLNTDENYSRSFVILTDGYVSVEKEAFDYIKNNLGKANFFAFGIGTSVNRYIIEGMAHCGLGEPFVAVNKAEGQKLAAKFIKYISSPVLTSVNFKFDGFEAYDVIPEKIPDLFAERPLIITGKFKGTTSGTINFSGESGNKDYHQAWNVTDNLKKEQLKAIKYLWAREKIRMLSDYSLLGANNELKSDIINLGKKYNLLTEYTSFVAIDSEISNESGKQTTVKQPLPLPDGVSNLAVGYSSNMNKSVRYSSGFGSGYKKADKAMASQSLEFQETDFEPDEEEASEDVVFNVVEEMPKFNGGSLKTFQKYVEDHLVYPKEAIEKGISGRVFVRFVVDEKGNITDVKIIRGVDELLDNEALRVIKSAPKWIPGKQRGKPVKVTLTIPVEFKLQS